MQKPLKVLFATSEAHPLIKTGGLADVSGSLPVALNRHGQDVRLVLPAYPQAVQNCAARKKVAELTLIGAEKPVGLFEARIPDSNTIVYLIDSAEHFDREGNPYVNEQGQDWPDNAERFCLFSRAIAAIALGVAGIEWKPNLVHCNDWQTALVPAFLSVQEIKIPTLFTLHNLAYQGIFPASMFATLELPKSLWGPDGLEFYDQLSFIKGGLVYADKISTVSPNYMKEICTSEFGFGLEGLLRKRGRDLHGILNGVDYATWDPTTDKLIAKQFNIASVSINKPENKRELQKKMNLPLDANVPLIGMVGRLVEQKGIDLVIEALPDLMKLSIQLVILGSGNKQFEAVLQAAQQNYRAKLSIRIGYDESLAHLIEAGADLFLMPSRFEPCGLNQIYSQRYGTIPIVRKTGGLADSVINATEPRLEEGTATGFAFKQPSVESMMRAVVRALDLYRNRLEWRKVMRAAMKTDFSWDKSAGQYIELYRSMLLVQTEVPVQ